MSFRPWLATAGASLVAAVVAVTVATPALASTSSSSAAGVHQQEKRYLVRYAPRTDVAAAARELRTEGIAVRRTFSHVVRGAAVLATPTEAAALAETPGVLAVEVDTRVHATDLQPAAPWGLDRIDQRALPLSTTYTAPAQGAGVTTFVVDTGVLAEHSQFGGRVRSGWSAINDGRGSSDCNGHGTHVAGSIAGSTYGVAKAATIVPVRVLDCAGSGYMSDVVAGLDWVAAQHAAGTPAVVNLSLGGAASSTLDAALSNVINDGVTAAVAAGNSAVDACTKSPARVPAALTVAASDSSDRQASFSNHGACVDLYAPGVAIASAWYTSTTATATSSGTSMASPHAAGAAAVLLSQKPTLTPAEVSAQLTTQATSGVLTGTTSGTPNRLLFVAAPAPTSGPVVTAPSAATNVKALRGKRSASVSWTLGANGGSPLTGQSVNVYTGTKKVAVVPVSATASTVTVGSLTAGTTYTFSVIETNKVGSSPESAKSNAVTPTR